VIFYHRKNIKSTGKTLTLTPVPRAVFLL